MLSLFQKLCMNRPRLRRMLCHALLEWDAFQTEVYTQPIENPNRY